MRPRSRRRGGAVGAAVVALYAVAALVTLRHGPLRLRPLYEGPVSVPPYHFVNPPAALSHNNVKPKAGTATVDWLPSGNDSSSPSAPDGQAIVSLPKGVVAAHPPDTGAQARFEPLDPATLPSVGKGLFVDGNVYRITLEYTPSHTPITTYSKAPTVLLQWATSAVGLAYSADGTTWRRLDAQVLPAPQAFVSADFAGNGYYAPVGSGTAPITSSKKGFPVATVLTIVFIALPLAGIVWFVFPRKEPTPAKPKGRNTRGTGPPRRR